MEIRAMLKLIGHAAVFEKEVLLDNCDAKRLLNVGDKTLYRWRKQKLINSRLIGNKHYYVKADLVKVMENT